MRSTAPLGLLVGLSVGGLAAALSSALPGGVAAASGRVVRIEDQRSRRVFVPAGERVMGISGDDDLATLDQECSLAFEQRDVRGFPLPNNEIVTFCGLYHKQNEAMADRATDDAGHVFFKARSLCDI